MSDPDSEGQSLPATTLEGDPPTVSPADFSEATSPALLPISAGLPAAEPIAPGAAAVTNAAVIGALLPIPVAPAAPAVTVASAFPNAASASAVQLTAVASAFPNAAAASAIQPTAASKLTMQVLLRTMIEKNASDLLITTASPPQLRIDGKLYPLKIPPLTPVETKRLCYSVLTEKQRAEFENEFEMDLSFPVAGLARFRANIFYQRNAVAGAFRQIPFRVKSFEELQLPRVLAEVARKPRGLVLVTGATGSGKSTTLAAMVDLINNERQGHIVTIEDPVEYLHTHKMCVVNQRELGSDTKSFKRALKYVLRQNPDVVLIGEMRDLETMEAAISISETGHLALATLHTNSTIQTINRIIDAFPPSQQGQVRAQLSLTLEAVVCQVLIPKVGGGRVMAMEILLPNPAIRNLIREDKIHQIYSSMQTGRSKSGMQTLNQSLADLVIAKKVRLEDAAVVSSDPEELKQIISNPTGAPTMRAQK